MSISKHKPKQRFCQRPLTLHVYVSTSGCWIVAGTVVPNNRVAIWASLVLGTLIAWLSTALCRRIARRAAKARGDLSLPPEQSPLISLIASGPTFYGLCAMAVSTNLAALQGVAVTSVTLDMAGDKAVITQLLIACLLLEHLIPLAGRTARRLCNAYRYMIRDDVRREIDQALRQVDPHVIEGVATESSSEDKGRSLP